MEESGYTNPGCNPNTTGAAQLGLHTRATWDERCDKASALALSAERLVSLLSVEGAGKLFLESDPVEGEYSRILRLLWGLGLTGETAEGLGIWEYPGPVEAPAWFVAGALGWKGYGREKATKAARQILNVLEAEGYLRCVRQARAQQGKVYQANPFRLPDWPRAEAVLKGVGYEFTTYLPVVPLLQDPDRELRLVYLKDAILKRVGHGLRALPIFHELSEEKAKILRVLCHLSYLNHDSTGKPDLYHVVQFSSEAIAAFQKWDRCESWRSYSTYILESLVEEGYLRLIDRPPHLAGALFQPNPHKNENMPLPRRRKA